MAGEIDLGYERGLKTGAEAGGLLAQVVHHHESIDPFGESGEVFHFGGGGQLATGLAAFEDERTKIGAGGIDGGGKSRAAGANNYYIFNRRFAHG